MKRPRKSLGFVETSRVAFDPAYAPKGWNYDQLGRPGVVYMARPQLAVGRQKQGLISRTATRETA